MAKKKKGVASKIGTGLAHVQSLVDDVLVMGFKGLKRIGKKGNKKIDTETVSGKLKDGFKKTARFLGEMGDTYFDKYEDLKAKKSDEKKSK